MKKVLGLMFVCVLGCTNLWAVGSDKGIVDKVLEEVSDKKLLALYNKVSKNPKNKGLQKKFELEKERLLTRIQELLDEIPVEKR